MPSVIDSGNPRLGDIRYCLVRDFPKYLIFFRVDADMVEIVRVLHGMRNISKLLGEEGDE